MGCWVKCEWCRKRNAATPDEAERIRKGSGWGVFGTDVVCPECQAAFWRDRIDMDRARAAGRAIAEGAQ